MFLIEIGSHCIVNPAATGVIPLNYFTFPKSASIKSIFIFSRCKATEMGINHGKIRKKKSKSIGFAPFFIFNNIPRWGSQATQLPQHPKPTKTLKLKLFFHVTNTSLLRHPPPSPSPSVSDSQMTVWVRGPESE